MKNKGKIAPFMPTQKKKPQPPVKTNVGETNNAEAGGVAPRFEKGDSQVWEGVRKKRTKPNLRLLPKKGWTEKDSSKELPTIQALFDRSQ